MFDWEWEIFDRFINEGNFEILKSSHLALPIKSFCVKRDKNLDIMIDTVCEPNVKSKIIPYPVGSVFKSENTIQFKSGDLLVTAIGGELLKWHSSMDTKNNTHHQNESASIHKIKCAIKEESQSKYVIEWLANIDDSHHIWPGITNEKINTVHSRQLQINEKTFSITGKRSLSGGSKNCLNVSIDGIDLYLSTCENLIFEKSKKPGFIVYDGFPSEEARRKIRECIAFVLGFPLVYLGHTVFNTNWQLVSFEAISPHNDMDGKAFNLAGAFPIAPLSKRLIGNSKTPNLIDYQIVSDMVNAIYSKYDEYQLRHFFWLYWHAACAPNPIQAVSFGAALEALQKAFLSATELPITNLLSEKNWSVFRDCLVKALDDLDIPEINPNEQAGLEVLKNNIGSFNRAPQKAVMKKLASHLGIKLSDMELKAWNQRNSDAHGKKMGEHESIDRVRNPKIIKMLCNRFLLSMTKASNSYFDYYTPDYPCKRITDPVIE